MSKKIVILNGSPRRSGNTSALVKAFTRGTEEAGNTVTEFFLDGMDIHGCKGCFGGDNSRDCPCVQKDGFDHLRWNNLGHVLAGGNMAVGDIEGKREIQEAYTLGKKIIYRSEIRPAVPPSNIWTSK